MANWFARQAERTAESIKRVWASNYPKWLWLVNLAVGVLAGTLFAILAFDGTTAEKAGVGIAVTVAAALIFFGFTYGVVRARGDWGRTPRSDRFGGK